MRPQLQEIRDEPGTKYSQQHDNAKEMRQLDELAQTPRSPENTEDERVKKEQMGRTFGQ